MTAQLNALSAAQATSAAPGENARRELQARLTGLGKTVVEHALKI